MTTLTPAGQALDPWDGLTWDVQKAAGSHANDDLAYWRPLIERQAADRALAELRREVEDLRYQFAAYPGDGADGDGPLNDLLVACLALIDKAAKPEEGL